MSVTYLSEWLKKQENISESQKNSLSKQSSAWDVPGAKHTEDDFTNDVEQLIAFWAVLDKAEREGFTVKSGFARKGAWHVAVLASGGLITTEIDIDVFGRYWLITDEGHDFKEALDERIKELL